MKFISSMTDYDCLFTDLKIVLAELNHDSNYLFLSNPHPETPFTFKEIQDLGGKYGLTVYGFYSEKFDDIIYNSLPIIVRVNNDNSGAKHAVIVTKIKKNKVVFIDPAYGKVSMKKSEFLKIYDGYGLLIEKHKKMKCPEKPIKTIEKSDIVLISLLQIISGVSCLMGTYFISTQFPFYIPVILFAFFFVFEIILRRYLIYVMEKMDEKFLYQNKGQVNYSIYYEKYTKMKSNNILYFMNSIFALIIVIFLIVIIVMNSWLNLIYISMVILISVITKLLIRPRFHRNNMSIYQLENRLKRINNNDEFIKLSKDINKRAYKVVLTAKSWQYVKIGIYLLTVILVMALSSSTINITYLIFYLTLMVIIDQYLNQMLSMDEIYQKYKEGRNYVNQYYR